MVFVIFNNNLEDRTRDLMDKLSIKSLTTLEGKKGRIYILKEDQLKWLDDSGIKYKILAENKIEKYLTERGLLYLRNIRTNISL